MAAAPCKNCEDREALCHTFCPKYKEFEQKNEAKRQAKAMDNDRYSTPKRSKKNERLRRGIK